MKNTIPELDKLFEDVGTYRSTKDYEELLKFIKRFRKIAPYNAMLLHVQKPGSTYVASAREWKDQFDRHPITGARPLIILRPFGPVAFVYELGDTEGKDFPKEVEKPFEAKGSVSETQLEKFIESMRYVGVRYETQDYGTGLAGFIKVDEGSSIYKKKKSDGSFEESYFRLPFTMVVNSNLDPLTKLTTMYHELGHMFCGHLYNSQLKYLPERYSLGIEEREFEAESVCWLLCERQGIKNPSAEYLSGYLKENGEIPDVSIETVLKAVAAIELIWSGITAPRKELLIKKTI